MNKERFENKKKHQEQTLKKKIKQPTKNKNKKNKTKNISMDRNSHLDRYEKSQ